MHPALSHRSLRSTAQSATHRRRGKEKQPTVPSDSGAAPDFLRETIEPLMSGSEEIQDQQTIEQSVFQSLIHLANLYQWPLEEFVVDAPYPFNIGQLVERIQQRLGAEVGVAIVQEDTVRTTIVTYREYDNDFRLHYIPLENYYNLLQRNQPDHRTSLVSSIFCYLYHIAGIPDYTQGDGSYTGNVYEYLAEMWTMDDGEENKEQVAMLLEHLAKGRYCIKRFEKMSHLRHFARRIERFKPQSFSDYRLLILARRFLNLYQTYPNQSVFKSLPSYDFMESEGESMFFDAFFSFVWSCRDELMFEIQRNVDEEIGNSSAIMQPVSIQHFDTPQTSVTLDLNYITALFEHMDNLMVWLGNLTFKPADLKGGKKLLIHILDEKS